MGVSSASGADERRDGFDAARFAAFFTVLFVVFRAAGFRLFVDAFFDCFAIRQVLAQNAGEAVRRLRRVLGFAPMMRYLTLVLVFLICTVERTVAQQTSVAGTWKLISYETVTPSGVRTFPLGEDAVGLLIYQPSGRMSVQFMRRDRPKFKSGDAWRGSLEEEQAAFEGFFSYAGRYTVDSVRGVVTHHIDISSAPNYVGTDVERTFTVAGNRITLLTPQRQLAGQTSSAILIWERLD
jgi:hypothetical protein